MVEMDRLLVWVYCMGSVDVDLNGIGILFMLVRGGLNVLGGK